MKHGAQVKSQETSHVTYGGGSGLIYLVIGLALAVVQHAVSLMAAEACLFRPEACLSWPG